MTTTGHCFCRKTSWSFQGEPNWSCYCHCDDCRRNCSAPLVAWLGAPLKHFTWSGQQPKTLESSKGVQRHFCKDCGAPMGFEAEHYPNDMCIYAASMDDPNSFKPEFHVFYERKLPWLKLEDDLPKYKGSLQHSPDAKLNR